MSRLWPRSLAGRTALVLLLALTLAQGAGLGVSGGAWITEFAEGSDGGNRVVGVNATGGDGGSMGAMIGACATDLLAFIRRACPRP